MGESGAIVELRDRWTEIIEAIEGESDCEDFIVVKGEDDEEDL